MELPDVQSFKEDTISHNFYALLEKFKLTADPISIETIFVNITRLCNQACSHCYVDASPRRTEQMSRDSIDRCLDILSQHDSCRNLDITGGAPELNPDFDYFITEARKLKKHVMVRHNLTVIFDGNPQTGQFKKYLPEFFAGNQVEIIASLPSCDERFTDLQRGPGVFKKSIEGIRLLNKEGYGEDGTGLILNLVHNTNGPLLPADRENLEANYKQTLFSEYGLVFNKLYTVTNVPINRFRAQLERDRTYNAYMEMLVSAFSQSAMQALVCRSHISIGYDGRVYDCDFNQMLHMQIAIGSIPVTIFNLDFNTLMSRDILFGPHCFGYVLLVEVATELALFRPCRRQLKGPMGCLLNRVVHERMVISNHLMVSCEMNCSTGRSLLHLRKRRS